MRIARREQCRRHAEYGTADATRRLATQAKQAGASVIARGFMAAYPAFAYAVAWLVMTSCALLIRSCADARPGCTAV